MASAGATAVAAVWGWPAGGACAALLGGVLAVTWRAQRQLRQARGIIAGILGSEGLASSASSDFAAIERTLAGLSHRLVAQHPASGLPMREALFDRMACDAGGMLAVLAFTDLDRLTAFDPALSDQAFRTCIARLQRMLPAQRFLAQVDRVHLAIWFGNESETIASAELDAIAYALEDAINIPNSRLVPQIRIRTAAYDRERNADPSLFVNQTIAMFSIPQRSATCRPTDAISDQVRDQYALEQDLRQAIDRNEFRLEFQPLIDARQGRVDGAEALLRWQHPERGMIPPAIFIPIMEAAGLASEVGTWALNAAVREAQGWAAAGLGGLRVAVNVSALQLEQADLALMIQRILRRHKLQPGGLELELTESVATDDADHCRRIFTELRAMGVKLAVDDFGTGYSGFSSLRALAFDKIKIDRQFVTDIHARRDSQAICHSIIALGRGLDIRVLAEGVETREEFDWLRRNGCAHFQGYYFARPLGSQAFYNFARHRQHLQALIGQRSSSPEIIERLPA